MAAIRNPCNLQWRAKQAPPYLEQPPRPSDSQRLSVCLLGVLRLLACLGLGSWSWASKRMHLYDVSGPDHTRHTASTVQPGSASRCFYSRPRETNPGRGGLCSDPRSTPRWPLFAATAAPTTTPPQRRPPWLTDHPTIHPSTRLLESPGRPTVCVPASPAGVAMTPGA
jgi:hypothetical protein